MTDQPRKRGRPRTKPAPRERPAHIAKSSQERLTKRVDALARVRRPNVVRKAVRDEHKAAFLVEYAKWGNIGAACDRARIGRRSFYQWTDPRATTYDEEFARATDEAREKVIDGLEQEAFRRAADKSDLMLIFTLKNNRERYAERQKVEVTGADGGPVVYADAKDALLRKLDSLASRERPILDAGDGVTVHELSPMLPMRKRA